MDNNIKKTFSITLVATVIILYLIYNFLLRENINNLIELEHQLNIQSLIYESQVQDYMNIQSNKELLLALYNEITRELVAFNYIPHAMVNISNLMNQKNITENKFNIGNRQEVNYIGNVGNFYKNIFIVPLNISGVGSYKDIMKYLNSLNYLHYFILVDRVNIVPTLETELFYLDLNVSIVVGENY